MREHDQVLFQGPPGVGTHLAVALWVKDAKSGSSVGSHRHDDLLHLLQRDADIPIHRLEDEKYVNAALLIIDEVGFQQLSRQEAALLFRLARCRHEKSSTILTTDKSVKDWPEILAGDEVMATALLDRLMRPCHVFNIMGRSFRLPDLEAQIQGGGPFHDPWASSPWTPLSRGLRPPNAALRSS